LSKQFVDFGTDKLTLTIPMGDFRVKNSKPFWVDPPKKRPNEVEAPKIPLLTTIEGEEINANKIFINREITKEKEKQIKAKTDLSLSINPRGLKVEFNPSKFGESNDPTKLGKIKQIREVQIPEIQTYLEKDLGIDCDLTSAKLFRLDIANQTELLRNFNSYFPLFRSIQGFKQPKKIDYGNGFQFGTANNVSIIYDKLGQLGVTKGFSNVIRSELQIEKPKGISTLGIYMNLEEEHLKGEYNTFTAKRFLRHTNIQTDLSFQEVSNRLAIYMQTQNHKKAINSLIMGYGTNQLIEKLSENFRDWKTSLTDILIEKGFHLRTAKRRILDIEKEFRFQSSFIEVIQKEENLELSLEEMFQEVKELLFKAK
jgi:hypothetical protein